MQKIVKMSLLCLSLLIISSSISMDPKRPFFKGGKTLRTIKKTSRPYRGSYSTSSIMREKNARDLEEAIWHNNIEKAREAIQYGADVNGVSTSRLLINNNLPLLFIAIRQTLLERSVDDNLELVKLLLNNKADVDIKDNHGRTALEDTININYPHKRNLNERMVKLLLAYRADIHQPILEKAENASSEIKKIIEDYVNLLERVQTDPYNKQTLHDAIKDDYHLLVLDLIKRGALVNETDLKLAKDFGSERSGRIIFNRLRLTCQVGGISKTGLIKAEPELPQEIWQEIARFTH